jgi:hypothetical protein
MLVDAAHVASILDSCVVAHTDSIKHQHNLRRYEPNACLYESSLQVLCFSSSNFDDVMREIDVYWRINR